MFIMLATALLEAPATEVVVVRAESLREPSSTGQVIVGDFLQAQAGGRLDEVLRVVPGVGLFRRTASGAANATIQGLSLRPIAPNGAGRALVSLDGVPQNDPFGGWIYWGRYDPLFLQQVEIKRGGAGAGFGPMALTGTLDLTEARGQPATLNANLGNLGASHLAARKSFRSQGAVFTAMAAYDASDGTIPIAARQRGPADLAADFQTVSVTLVTDIERNNGAWSLRASGFNESKGAGLVGGQSDALGLDVSVARRLVGGLGQGRFIVYAQGRDFSNSTVSVNAGRLTSTPALDQYATPSSAIGGSLVFIPANGLLLPALSIDGRRADGETRELFRYQGRDFTRTRIAGGQQDFLGIGLSPPRPLPFGGGSVSLDGSVRLDYWANRNALRLETDRTTGIPTLLERVGDKSGTIASGRLSLAQTAGPLQLSVYRTFRPPTLNELHRPFRVGNDVTEANAALVPETLLGADFEMRQRRVIGRSTLTTVLTIYVNQLRDPIANVTLAMGPGVLPRVGFLPAGGSLRERRNVGRVDAVGGEVSLNWDGGPLAPNWSLAVSTTDARVDGGTVLPSLTGKRPAQAPRWSAVGSVNFPVSQNLDLGLVLRGESARFEDDLNTRKLAAYGALDLRAKWQLGTQKAFFVTAENILDTPITTAKAGDGSVSFAQGRIVRFGLKLTQ